MHPPVSPCRTALRERLCYFLITIFGLAIGYGSRQVSSKSSFIHDYAGDSIWAAMIYFGFRFLLPRADTTKSLGAALAFTWFIELTQSYQAPWLNAARHTRLGGLVLGYAFLWSDLLMYSLGILAVWAVDRFLIVKPVP